MDQNHSNPQEYVGDSTQISNHAASFNYLPADEVLTGQKVVSSPQGTDSSEKKQSDDSVIITELGTSSSNNESKIEEENEEKANGEKKHPEKEDKGSSRNIDDKKSPEDVLKEMRMRKTHDLYCPNCTNSITDTAKFIKKGEETFPYKKDKFLLWFVIVISFKYPFIYIPWFYNHTPGPDEPHKKHVPGWLWFVLVVVLLLLSAIVLPPIDIKGSWIFLLWVKYFPSNSVLPVISLLLLAILALCWASISWKKRTKPTKFVDVPVKEQNKPEDPFNGPGSGKNIVDPPPPKPARLGVVDFFWKHIVTPLQNLLPDIVKSIVYGGLIESITSLSVVSSAAGSGASALNLAVLGLANLFSGLFIVFHNLIGLRRGPRYPSWSKDHDPSLVAVDPYKELLGSKDNCIIHCIVVGVSFIFFCVIPPLVYGFSSKITDTGHYGEAAVVFAVSLVCVVSLSFAKAYAFGIDRLKTMAEYTGIAIGASALSFVSSLYARDKLEKYI